MNQNNPTKISIRIDKRVAIKSMRSQASLKNIIMTSLISTINLIRKLLNIKRKIELNMLTTM